MRSALISRPVKSWALLGESGSGKSITLRSIMGLSRRYGEVTGRVMWQGENLVAKPERELRKIRGKDIAMIFQEPMSSLNPLLTVGVQIIENLVAHTTMDKKARQARAIELLELVGIPDASRRLDDYPHQFSGGMRQRVMIAIALASDPKLLLADEPTTALDVTIQKQILKLILDLSKELGMSVILVTHDLGVAAQTCDRLAVMYGGKLVEKGETRDVLRNPLHRYTLAVAIGAGKCGTTHAAVFVAGHAAQPNESTKRMCLRPALCARAARMCGTKTTA